jgi:creatinine amidohydrolase
MENFPWNRVATVPEGVKEAADLAVLRSLSPSEVRGYIGDGNYGGAYQKPDEDMLRLWQAGVEETRSLIDAL